MALCLLGFWLLLRNEWQIGMFTCMHYDNISHTHTHTHTHAHKEMKVALRRFSGNQIERFSQITEKTKKRDASLTDVQDIHEDLFQQQGSIIFPWSKTGYSLALLTITVNCNNYLEILPNVSVSSFVLGFVNDYWPGCCISLDFADSMLSKVTF